MSFNKVISKILLETSEVKIPQKKWVKIKNKGDLKSIATNILELVNNAYSSIGGHIKINSINDILSDEFNVWEVIDVDGDNEIDAVTFGKTTNAGVKASGMGHDGESLSKKTVLDKRAKDLKRPYHYVEVSGKVAEILLQKYNIPYIESEEEIKKVLRKPITYYGEHPKGLFPKIKGWYSRNIGGRANETKILLGIPKI